MRRYEIVRQLDMVRQQIADMNKSLNRASPPRLVVISKTMPVPDILYAYEAGQRVFGENYVNELVSKASQMPKDVLWHFVGHLQSNKVGKLLSVENLDVIETVESEKLANQLQRLLPKTRKLKIFIQINTSLEENKFGMDLQRAIVLAKHIKTKCPSLLICGLMTIGSIAHMNSQENSDFQALRSCRQVLAKELNLDEETLELSMGMSSDFEEAVSGVSEHD